MTVDDFREVMSKRTDSDLIKILTIDRDQFQPNAIVAAEEELKKRNLAFDQIDALIAEARKKTEKEKPIPETKGRKGGANLSVIGWILFVVGIVIMFKSLVFFVFYGPIFLTTFIISIILMTKKQVGSGVFLLLLTLILPPLFWAGIFANKVSDAMNTVQGERKTDSQEKIQNIKFEDIRIFHRGNFMYCEGKVRNTGTTIFDNVKVKVEWLDKDDVIVDTDYAYAVSFGEGLRPREAKSFSIMTRRDSRMKGGRYYVID